MEIRKIAVIGSGRLGRGIAENAATQGYEVILFSQGAGSQNAPFKIEKHLDQRLAKWAITESEKRVILSRISYTSDFNELNKVDLMVEATVDNFEMKKEILQTADRLCEANVVFISTSATIGVSQLAQTISRSNSLVGLHFITPVPKVPVVELSFTNNTSADSIQIAKSFAKNLGKETVELAESPALVNPRTLITLVNEAAYMVDEGVADIHNVEKTLKESFGMKQGPFEMADHTGLDIILNWMEQLRERLGDRYTPAPLIRRLVRKGTLGVKTGKGFFSYNNEGIIINPVSKEEVN